MDSPRLIQNGGPRASGRALVADGDSAVREVVSAILNEAGFDVTVVTSGGQAVSQVVQGSFRLVVLDVRMPGDGLAAVRAIKTGWPVVKVLLISSYPAYREAALAHGADGFISKPFGASELLAAAGRVLHCDMLGPG